MAISPNPDYAFIDKQFALVGRSDPLDILQKSSERIARLIRNATESDLLQSPAPSKWSVNQLIAHLADTEWIFGFRIRTILCDERPRIIGIDQDLWMERQQHNSRTPEENLERFTVLRQQNLLFWKERSGEELARAAHHPDAQIDMSLGFFLKLMAGHDLNHLQQMCSILRIPFGDLLHRQADREH